jgi:hypothetical protein
MQIRKKEEIYEKKANGAETHKENADYGGDE